MTKHSFTYQERYAVWVTHGERCYICRELVAFDQMQVDHIIPEALLEKPAVLKQVLSDLGRADDFNLTSFENWMPSCGDCNRAKNDTIFETSPLIQLVLQRAKEKNERAKAFAAEVISKQKISRAMGVLIVALEQKKTDAEILDKIAPLIELHTAQRDTAVKNEPIVLSPLFEVISNDGHIVLIKGPYGIGARPASPNPHPSWNCPNCGSIAGWNGARCVVCGQMDED